ncbi:hypothetical protein BSN81_16760 [Acinetobacter baylyi]|nr:hypothetical protein [Acinetobacter baylyi]KAF2374198.1 hypothetical protein BSN81_16760 [Acinetobacter baylyi]
MRRTLLQGRGFVCCHLKGTVNPGRESCAPECKAQEAATLLQVFFPHAGEQTSKALLWMQQQSAVRPKQKTSGKAQHSLGNQCQFCGQARLVSA